MCSLVPLRSHKAEDIGTRKLSSRSRLGGSIVPLHVWSSSSSSSFCFIGAASWCSLQLILKDVEAQRRIGLGAGYGGFFKIYFFNLWAGLKCKGMCTTSLSRFHRFGDCGNSCLISQGWGCCWRCQRKGGTGSWSVNYNFRELRCDEGRVINIQYISLPRLSFLV